MAGDGVIDKDWSKTGGGSLRKACETVERDLVKFRIDLNAFEMAFPGDSECWQGEAASEEQCFITSDKSEMETLIRELEILIDEVKDGSDERQLCERDN